jgi:hypothetical protein
MLANFLGRKVAIIVGLMLSTSMAFGQFPSGQHADRDAYKMLQDHLHKTFDDSGLRTGSVVQTAFGQPTQTQMTPTQTALPAFGAPGIGGDGGWGGAGCGEVGSGALPAFTGPATTYNPAPVTGDAYVAPPVEGPVYGQTPVYGSAAPTYAGVPQVQAPIAGGQVGGVLGEVPSYSYGTPGFAGYGAEPCAEPFPLQIGPSPLATGNCCRGCCRFCFSADYLNWYVKGQKLPELVSTSPLGTGPTLAGRKFEPTTNILFGGDRQDDENVDGFRFRGSLALDCCCCNKIDFEYFSLNSNDFFYSRETPGDNDILARPFYNPWTGNEDAEFVGYPGLIDGRIDVRGRTDFQGYGVWWRHNLMCCNGGFGRGGRLGGLLGGGRGGCGGGSCGGGNCGGGCGVDPCGGGAACGSGGCGALFGGGAGGGPLAGYGCAPRRRRSWMPCRIDLIAGYRHLDLDESVTIREYLTVTDPAGPVPAGTTFDIFDSFRTQNDFDGFDFGFGWEWCRGKLGLNALTKVAFGQVRRRTEIRGFTDITLPTQPVTNYTGGLLALPSNIGNYDETDFTVVPEVGFNLSYQLSCKMRLNFGYSLIFFPEVLRPGGVIDLDVDPRQLPPPIVTDSDRPEYKNYLDDFWAQGFNVGVEYCF